MTKRIGLSQAANKLQKFDRSQLHTSYYNTKTCCFKILYLNFLLQKVYALSYFV